jgi:hypothetical protein
MGWGARFAGVLVAYAVLSACGGAGPEGQTLPAATAEATADPSGTPRPSAAASPGPTSSETPTPLDAGGVPAAGAEHSAKGAEGFVRQWISAANDAFAGGNTVRWRALSLPSCKSCEKRAAAVEKTYKLGGRIEGGQLTVRDVAATPIRVGERTVVLAKVTASRETHLDESGKTVSDHAGSSLRLVFYLNWADGEWRVAEIQLGTDR